MAIDVDQGIRGEQVVDAMTRITLSRGAPRTIRVDNGIHFTDPKYPGSAVEEVKLAIANKGFSAATPSRSPARRTTPIIGSPSRAILERTGKSNA